MLSDLNYFVSVEQEGGAGGEEPPMAEPGPGPAPTRTAAQTVAEIAASMAPEPKFTAPVGIPTSFDEIYRAAEIKAPVHGYTIFKVADMLQSEHIRSLPAEVKRSSILLALDAAGVKLQEIIEDAVRRDRALDTFERVQQKSVEELEARKNEENRQIQAEMDRLVAEHRARIQANNDAVAKEKEKFYGRSEERRVGKECRL